MVILENIDIDIVIDKAILQNIDIDKISNRFKFGRSNRATWGRVPRPSERLSLFPICFLFQFQQIHCFPHWEVLFFYLWLHLEMFVVAN